MTRCAVREDAQDGVGAGARCVVSECHAIGPIVPVAGAGELGALPGAAHRLANLVH